jgi:hypothetical protein
VAARGGAGRNRRVSGREMGGWAGLGLEGARSEANRRGLAACEVNRRGVGFWRFRATGNAVAVVTGWSSGCWGARITDKRKRICCSHCF